MDGTIWFEDLPGGGTRFAFDLPLLPTPPHGTAGREGRPLLLHIDDDHQLCEAMIAALEDVATCVCVAGVEDARVVLRGGGPSLAVLDITVDGGNGAVLLPELVDREGRPVPLVLLSGAEVSPEIARRATAILVKGRHDLAAVIDTVRRLLREMEARR